MVGSLSIEKGHHGQTVADVFHTFTCHGPATQTHNPKEPRQNKLIDFSFCRRRLQSPIGPRFVGNRRLESPPTTIRAVADRPQIRRQSATGVASYNHQRIVKLL
ncbi:MAG: hypothetical protein A2V70_17650 [Planctomycetes bacterium RBG_13_63_9]|nr:MAG: hypothetical protein A2V70_17650 [Planctomycetes bacterium RBG_13_63_9]